MNGLLLMLVSLLSGPPPATAIGPDAVVARVQGPRGAIIIKAARLQSFVADRPGVSVSNALQDLIDFELLAAEARVRGFDNGQEVKHARAQAMVTRYLIEDFEALWRPEKLPLGEVKEAYQRVERHFVHPELRDANHILVSENQKRPEDPILDARAKALAHKIHAAIESDLPADGGAFLARAAPFLADASAAGLQVNPQSLKRFAFRGRYAPAFTSPVFGVAQAPTLMAPFPTRFGYHVVWLNEIIPARNDGFEAAEKEVRTRFAPIMRKREIRLLTDRLAGQYPPINQAPGVYGLMNLFPLSAVALRRGVPETANE